MDSDERSGPRMLRHKRSQSLPILIPGCGRPHRLFSNFHQDQFEKNVAAWCLPASSKFRGFSLTKCDATMERNRHSSTSGGTYFLTLPRLGILLDFFVLPCLRNWSEIKSESIGDKMDGTAT
jgi:hypothetical protein